VGMDLVSIRARCFSSIRRNSGRSRASGHWHFSKHVLVVGIQENGRCQPSPACTTVTASHHRSSFYSAGYRNSPISHHGFTAYRAIRRKPYKYGVPQASLRVGAKDFASQSNDLQFFFRCSNEGLQTLPGLQPVTSQAIGIAFAAIDLPLFR
jgi:hypothetical protein